MKNFYEFCESLRGDLINKLKDSRLKGTLVGKEERTEYPKVGDVYRSDSGKIYEIIRIEDGKVFTTMRPVAKASFGLDTFLDYIEQGRLVRIH